MERFNWIKFVSAILLKAYYEAKREAARVAKQARQMEVLSFKMQFLHVLSPEKVIFDFSFLQIFLWKSSINFIYFFNLLQEMKAAKEKENRTRRGFLDDSSLSCLLSDDTVSVDR